MPIDRNNGALWTFGVASALAIAGALASKRGSRSSDYETEWLNEDEFSMREWDCIAAVRRGANVLKLFARKDGAKIEYAGGRQADYELVYEWLRSPDARLSEVRGFESTYWSAGEIDPSEDLFDQVDLF